MSHNQPSWVAEEPSKTGRSAVQGFVAMRQNDAFCPIAGNRSCCSSDLKPSAAKTGTAAAVARLLAQKNRKHLEPAVAMIVGILALAVLNIVIYGIDNLYFFIYSTIGLGLTFEYGWIGVILRAAVASDHDYEDAQHACDRSANQPANGSQHHPCQQDHPNTEERAPIQPTRSPLRKRIKSYDNLPASRRTMKYRCSLTVYR